MAGFELLEDFFGSRDDVFGEAGESGDLDAVAFFGAAGEDLAEEDDLLVPLLHGDVVVLHGAAALREIGEGFRKRVAIRQDVEHAAAREGVAGQGGR